LLYDTDINTDKDHQTQRLYKYYNDRSYWCKAEKAEFAKLNEIYRKTENE